MRGPEAADWALSRGLSALTSAELAGVMGIGRRAGAAATDVLCAAESG